MEKSAWQIFKSCRAQCTNKSHDVHLAIVQTMQSQEAQVMLTTIRHTNPHSVDDKNWLFTVVCAVIGH